MYHISKSTRKFCGIGGLAWSVVALGCTALHLLIEHPN